MLYEVITTGPQIFTVRTIDIDNDIERYYQRHYINIVREKFDRWLFSLIPEKTERMCSCTIKNIRDEGDSVTIELSDGGARKEIRTKYLVGADGAGSIVRKHIDAPRSPEKYISVITSYSIHYTKLYEKKNPQPPFCCIQLPQR